MIICLRQMTAHRRWHTPSPDTVSSEFQSPQTISLKQTDKQLYHCFFASTASHHSYNIPITLDL